MGHVYHCLGHYDIALHYYNLSLKINQKALPPLHPDIAMNYRNMGLLYADKGELEQALKYLKDAKKIYRRSLQSHSPDAVSIKKAIQYVSDKLKKI